MFWFKQSCGGRLEYIFKHDVAGMFSKQSGFQCLFTAYTERYCFVCKRKNGLAIYELPSTIRIVSIVRPVRLEVRTSGFHPENRSSILLRDARIATVAATE